MVNLTIDEIHHRIEHSMHGERPRWTSFGAIVTTPIFVENMGNEDDA